MRDRVAIALRIKAMLAPSCSLHVALRLQRLSHGTEERGRERERERERDDRSTVRARLEGRLHHGCDSPRTVMNIVFESVAEDI